ncbi:hypothetical protein GOP47_0020586 [Adiantum capillus-veneris]|uniref:Uncharacterized protein n=1 Tax=Adiantum capillus-veneris TaxID=13818 RepID=A0A9D4UBC1_ADICA|nr:hypothetical protein GOP47_0020586 [Adiantum capillus-veneris]
MEGDCLSIMREGNCIPQKSIMREILSIMQEGNCIPQKSERVECIIESLPSTTSKDTRRYDEQLQTLEEKRKPTLSMAWAHTKLCEELLDKKKEAGNH